MANWVKVAAEADCPVAAPPGEPPDGIGILLANQDGALSALRDRCSHEDYPLSDGELDGGDVVCMYHGARFDVCSGARKTLPAIRPVRAFPVEIRDGDVYVDVE